MHKIHTLILISALLGAAAASVAATPADRSGAEAAHSFAPGEVELLPSRLTENRTRDSLWIASIPVQSLLHSWRTTAGVYSGYEGGYTSVRKLGGWESLDCDIRGHTTGHLLSAMARLGMKEKSDSLITGLAEVQAQYGTGYLSAFAEGLIDRLIAGKQVWVPFYTLHKVLQGLLDQYSILGNAQALELARGMGDWAWTKLKPLDEETRRRMLRTEFGGFGEAMYNLYAITGDERHLWVARFFYHNDRIDPLKRGETSFGRAHANTFIPKLLAECRNYELGGGQDSRDAAETFFVSMVREHAFVTGELSDIEHLFDPAEQYKHLTGHTGENCCTYNMLKLADRLWCYEPRAWISDYYERALYNHIIGQQDPSTSMVCYYTPLQTGAWRLYSTAMDSFWCCVGSGFESPARYSEGIYYHSGDTVYVNLFVPSRLKTGDFTLTQDTQMPDAGRSTLILEGKGKPVLKIRRPWWSTYMIVNGRKVKEGPSSYITVRRPGARVEIELGMELREVPAAGDSSRVALMYGPVVLGGRLEAVHNPFSDPGKHNDYYDYDYGTYPDVCYASTAEFEHTGGLHFTGPDGISVEPLYDLHHCRYVVYWRKDVTADRQAPSGKKYLATDMGIKGDGETLNTAAFQDAVDRIAASGGGTLVLPRGRYLSGSVELKDGVGLHLESGAILLGSTDPRDYGTPSATKGTEDEATLALLTARGAHDISLTGSGAIDGRGLQLALAIDSLIHTGELIDPAYGVRRRRPSGTVRPKLIYFEGCRDVSIKGLHLTSSANWGLSLDRCEDVSIRGLDIVNRAYWNNDGIDISDCRRVSVSRCSIDSADDGICLKSHIPGAGCSDIVISDCDIASSASAVKLGTASWGGFRDIVVRDIRVHDTFRSAIAIECVDGGVAQDILVEGIDAVNTGNPLFIRLGKRSGDSPGVLKGVTIRRLNCQVPFGRPDSEYDIRGPETGDLCNPIPSSITGIPGAPVQDVLLEDIKISCPGRGTKGMACIPLWRVQDVPEKESGYPEFSMFGELPSWGLYIRHAEGVTLKNVHLNVAREDFRPAVVLDDVSGYDGSSLSMDGPGGDLIFASPSCR